jgi:hypothetical protein
MMAHQIQSRRSSRCRRPHHQRVTALESAAEKNSQRNVGDETRAHRLTQPVVYFSAISSGPCEWASSTRATSTVLISTISRSQQACEPAEASTHWQSSSEGRPNSW